MMARSVDAYMHMAAAGIGGLTHIGHEHRRMAIENIRLWFEDDRFIDYRELLAALVEDGRWEMLLDSFYQTMPFGTGGRRGLVGIGPNRINPYMINASVQGHCRFLRDKYPDVASPFVVVAFDVRNFKDANGLLPACRNPLLGMTSRDLARYAAGVYAANGIVVYTLATGDDRLISTPELSFLIRWLGATGGLNVSASHNPPDDNGGKVYNRYGGQDVPPDDEALAAIVARTTVIDHMDYEDAVRQGLIRTIPPAAREEYLHTNLELSLAPAARNAVIAYTPLHGTGLFTVGEVLRRAGFDVLLEPAQAVLDGDFPTVRFRIANPEVPASMEQALALAREKGADLVLSTDPDADRIGMMAPDAGGEWHFFNGNQIAAMLVDYTCRRRREAGTMPDRPVVVKTEVTSELISRIGRGYGAEVVGDLLVGFKYIAGVIQGLADAGRDPGDFVIGCEESHGILITPKVRDKDATGAALYLAELASLLKTEGSTFDAYLQAIYKKYGYSGTLLVSMVMKGAVGMEKIAAIQDALRAGPPREIAGLRVVEFLDHRNENGRFGPFKSETDRSARNVLIMRLENGARIMLRPSGTEPKIKVYFERITEPLGDTAGDDRLRAVAADVDAELAQLSRSFSRFVLGLIDIVLPEYALCISDLAPLDSKVDFVERFIPAFTAQAATDVSIEALSAWIDGDLGGSGYGKDPRALVGSAMRHYLEESLAAAPASRRWVLERMEKAFFFTE
ncbi:phospho-sugar mutase [bacterium]|nr:phospho-sugar mutase [candidate division CSSED10-310 bacterium]